MYMCIYPDCCSDYLCISSCPCRHAIGQSIFRVTNDCTFYLMKFPMSMCACPMSGPALPGNIGQLLPGSASSKKNKKMCMIGPL